MEMPKYTAARAPTKKTQIHLQTSSAMLTVKAFGEKYGKFPLKAGSLCWDAAKGKVGQCSSIGFVKGKKGERATLMVTSGRSKRRHFALKDECFALPQKDGFYRHPVDKSWIKVTGVLQQGKAVWLRYAYVMKGKKAATDVNATATETSGATVTDTATDANVTATETSGATVTDTATDANATATETSGTTVTDTATDASVTATETSGATVTDTATNVNATATETSASGHVANVAGLPSTLFVHAVYVIHACPLRYSYMSSTSFMHALYVIPAKPLRHSCMPSTFT